MNQSITDQAASQAKPARRSALDRAIIASVIAVATMNIVVLAQQMQTSPLLSAASPLLSAASKVAGASFA